MRWQCIEFKNGSNPYICKTKSEFKLMCKKYDLLKLKPGFWLAKGLRKKIKECVNIPRF